jgi:hypothetical protein
MEVRRMTARKDHIKRTWKIDYHAMARREPMPEGFMRWHEHDEYGWTVAHEAAANGHLPKGFDQWGWRTFKRGWTVAHVAARKGTLPEGFDRWEMADERGWTVAHEAASRGSLPAGFNQWDLRDEMRDTVAHVAACWGHLPEDFDRWDMIDTAGLTVADKAAMHKNLPAHVDRKKVNAIAYARCEENRKKLKAKGGPDDQ